MSEPVHRLEIRAVPDVLAPSANSQCTVDIHHACEVRMACAWRFSPRRWTALERRPDLKDELRGVLRPYSCERQRWLSDCRRSDTGHGVRGISPTGRTVSQPRPGLLGFIEQVYAARKAGVTLTQLKDNLRSPIPVSGMGEALPATTRLPSCSDATVTRRLAFAANARSGGGRPNGREVDWPAGQGEALQETSDRPHPVGWHRGRTMTQTGLEEIIVTPRRSASRVSGRRHRGHCFGATDPRARYH
jgi:hypothetical protein